MRTSNSISLLFLTAIFVLLHNGTLRMFVEVHHAMGTTHSHEELIDGPDMAHRKSPQYDIIDEKCPFRESALYRSIYVYPSPYDENWHGDILSVEGRNRVKGSKDEIDWPWIAVDHATKKEGKVHYDPYSPAIQYTTELLVRDIITHPESCLRTDDPEKATLFYVPYLPSVEYHNGTLSLGDYQTSPFGQALIEATEGKYDAWEKTFGLTSKYWQRRNGSDHILVFSEPLHGLWHPKSRRGSFHFIHSQKQLAPPIVISVELSRTFVETYPNCARKNILMPYPNTDGKWFNGKYDDEAKEIFLKNKNVDVPSSPTALQAEKQLARVSTNYTDQEFLRPRPLAQFYRAGSHGTCTKLRKTMSANFKCTPSGGWTQKKRVSQYTLGYRQSTFCPCPGGDSPSAKRMFDALHSGCIPIVLSHDFVWPFTREFDLYSVTNTEALPLESPLNPEEFSIRLHAQDYLEERYNASCHVNAETSSTLKDLQLLMESISSEEIRRLRTGAQQATDTYAYYSRRENLPDNPLQEGTLPDGGAAHALVNALSERATGRMWPSCREELEGMEGRRVKEANKFVC